MKKKKKEKNIFFKINGSRTLWAIIVSAIHDYINSSI